MATIPCGHDPAVDLIPQSSSGGLIGVRSTISISDRYVYHHEDGEVDTTPDRRRPNSTRTILFNALCDTCSTSFHNFLTGTLCIVPSRSTQVLRDLRHRVRLKLIDRQIRDHRRQETSDDEDDDEDDDDVEWIDYELEKVMEWHTSEEQIYAGWIQQFDEDGGHAPNKPASIEAVEGLDQVEYEEMVQEGSRRVKEEKCVICLEGLGPAAVKEDQPVVLKLPCHHMFHGCCIVEWLSFSHLCPLCRFNLPERE